MELLLTSNGLTNPTLTRTFDGLVDKAAAETTIAFIPTAANVERGNKDWLIRAMHELTARDYQVDIVELTALRGAQLAQALKPADVLFVGGGNVFYLSYWMQRSGLFDQLAECLDTKKYVGVSAGSMIVTPNLSLASQALENPVRYGHGQYDAFVPRHEGLGRTSHLVEFLLRPHLHNPDYPRATLHTIERATQNSAAPVYLIDDQSAVHVRGDAVTVVSEGEWYRLPRA